MERHEMRDILIAARAKISREGTWCKNRLAIPVIESDATEVQYCARGAIDAVIGIIHDDGRLDMMNSIERKEREAIVMAYLGTVLRQEADLFSMLMTKGIYFMPHDTPSGNIELVICFNNHRDVGQQHVLALFDRAIARLE